MLLGMPMLLGDADAPCHAPDLSRREGVSKFNATDSVRE
jgi:hypothetical protein